MSKRYLVLEILDPVTGRPTGRFRRVVVSDEPFSEPVPACDCPDGHDTWGEAYSCSAARSSVLADALAAK